MRKDARRTHALLIGVIVLAAVAAYWRTLDAYFIKDDLSIHLMTGGGYELNWKSWFRNLFWPVDRTLDDIFRPATYLTWLPDYLIFGPDPVPFRIGSLLWHAFNGACLYWLTWRLTGRRTPLAGFFAGLFFVIYPLHGEAVAWITQRFVLMGLAFSLLAMIAFHVHLESGRRPPLVLSWVFVGLACLSKELGITLPAVLVFMALFQGPSASWKQRIRKAAAVAAAGFLVLSIYFGLRLAVFGRFLGEGYAGWPSMQAYARDNLVFERMVSSLRTCLLPANRELVPDLWSHLLLGALVLAALVAARNLPSLLRSSEGRALSGLTLLFASLAFLPTIWIFLIHPNLAGSRFGYHFLSLPLALLAVLLVNPWQPPSSRRALPLALLPPLLLALVLGGVLVQNLTAYMRGGHQVRVIQEGLVREGRAAGDDGLLVVFRVPYEYAGCPTIDAYLPWLVRPPLVRKPRLAFPFVASLERSWWRKLGPGPEGLPAARARADSLRFLVARAWPPGLSRLFPDPLPEEGAHPPRLLDPPDGAVLPCPGPEPEWSFTAPEGTESYVLDLVVGPAGGPWTSLEDARHLRYALIPGRNASRRGPRITYRLSGGTQEGGPPDAWRWRAEHDYPPPQPVLWRIEARDAEGRSIGRSKTHRVVLIPGPGE